MKKKILIALSIIGAIAIGIGSFYFLSRPKLSAYAEEKTFTVEGVDNKLSFNGLVEYELNNYLASNGIRAQDLSETERKEIYDNIFSVIEQNEGSVDSSIEEGLSQMINYYINDEVATSTLNDIVASNNAFQEEAISNLESITTKSNTDVTEINNSIGNLQLTINDLSEKHSVLNTDTQNAFDVTSKAIQDNSTIIESLKETQGSDEKDIQVLEDSLTSLTNTVSSFQNEYEKYTETTDLAIKTLKESTDTRINNLEKSINEKISASDSSSAETIQDLQDKIKELSASLQASNDSLNNAAQDLSGELDNLNSATQNLSSELESSNNELKSLLESSSTELQTTLGSSISDVNNTVQTLKSNYEQYIADNNEEISNIKDRVDVLEKGFAMYKTTNNNAIYGIVGSINLTNDELKTLKQLVADNKTESENADNEIKNTIYENTQEQAQKNQTILDKITNILDQITSNKTSQDAKNSELEQSINNNKAEQESINDSMNGSIDTEHERISNFKDELDGLSDDVGNITSDVSGLSQQLDGYSIRVITEDEYNKLDASGSVDENTIYLIK